MMNTANASNIKIRKGTMITGKWHRRTYEVIKPIGSGAVGTVYLCKHHGQLVALKTSRRSLSMTAEVQVLKMLANEKVQDSRLGPYLFDVDDWMTDSGITYTFYVMEFIRGITLQEYVKKNGLQQLVPLLRQLLLQLDKIHQLGYVFGDLKHENIIVTYGQPTIRLIDVGGTTLLGRSVKEYTNFYDRAYWRLGTRVAEPSYDLFAVVMVVLTIFYPKQFTRTNGNSVDLLKRKIANMKQLRHLAPVLQKAISGKYKRARQMELAILSVRHRKRRHTRAIQSYIIEGISILMAMLIYVLIYFFYL